MGGGQLRLGDIGGALFVEDRCVSLVSLPPHFPRRGQDGIYLVGLVGSSGGNLALLARGELGEVTVVVTLPSVCRCGK